MKTSTPEKRIQEKLKTGFPGEKWIKSRKTQEESGRCQCFGK
jgi:hypothetical protein